MNKFDFIDYSTITNDDSCGITILNKDIDISTGKIIINGVEITDTKSWEKAISTLEEKDKEIERLKNGYCELKVKCNNGECDCTNEEYDGMAQCNMKLSLENDELRNILEKMGTNPNEILYLKNEVDKSNNIIDELEKEINNQLTMTRRLDKYNEGYFDATLNYYNKLKELKEGK